MASPARVTIHRKQVNGAVYDIAQHHKCGEATACVGNKRFVLRGFVALKTVTKRYKFPDQLVFTLLASKTESVREEQRNPSSWNSLEFYVPLEDSEELLLKALELVRAKRLTT